MRGMASFHFFQRGTLIIEKIRDHFYKRISEDDEVTLHDDDAMDL